MLFRSITSTTTTTTTQPITSTTTTTTTQPITSTTTTTTTTLPLGECYSVQNTQGADIGVHFYNTSNILSCNIVPDGATIQLCVYAGTGTSIYPWTNTDCTGSLASAVITSLVSNCVDASSCLGTTTSTTTTTTTLAVSCNNYNIVGTPSISVEWFGCGGSFFTQTVGAGGITVCAETGTVNQTGGSGSITDLGSC